MMKRIELQPRVHLNVMALNKFKTNYICIEFQMPLAAETASLYALVPKVLTRGCRRYPSLTSLARRAEELYGTNIRAYSSKSGEGQTVALAAYPLANEYALDDTDIFGETVNLMEQLLLDPVMEDGAFLSEYVESEKKNLIDTIHGEIDNKTNYALRQAIRKMCRGEAYAVDGNGTIADVEAITPESLTKAWKTILREAKVEVWAIGNIDEDKLQKQLCRMFAAFPPIKAAPITTLVQREGPETPSVYEEKMTMQQGKLVLGFRSGLVLADGIERYTAFAVFLSVYGAGATSKLFMNVREKLSLCYYCAAGADSLKGIMYVQSGIDPVNYEIAKNEILAQLQMVKEGKITDEEIENAKIGMINRCREIGDEAGSLKNWYSTRLLANRFDSPEEYIQAIRAVTKEQIMQAAEGVSLDVIYFLHGDSEPSAEGRE